MHNKLKLANNNQLRETINEGKEKNTDNGEKMQERKQIVYFTRYVIQYMVKEKAHLK